ncbi:unnamed protein product [Cylicocyclus nassatus]|uniref:Uncharacterized protein n=1 Tax=Cylicocyclus nassatus TaxID=53992 RepID=A0AA36M6T7_CYLNA|nr:unnamed protein product [Cylicocyclus nassatus]
MGTEAALLNLSETSEDKQLPEREEAQQDVLSSWTKELVRSKLPGRDRKTSWTTRGTSANYYMKPARHLKKSKNQVSNKKKRLPKEWKLSSIKLKRMRGECRLSVNRGIRSQPTLKIVNRPRQAQEEIQALQNQIQYLEAHIQAGGKSSTGRRNPRNGKDDTSTPAAKCMMPPKEPSQMSRAPSAGHRIDTIQIPAM